MSSTRKPDGNGSQTKAAKPSAVETIKQNSNYLRGTLAEELANEETSFAKDTTQVIKHHGIYQQDDRDLRGAKGPDGKRLGKAYSLMVRVKIPGGRLTGEQLLRQLQLCDELGNATMRLTNRQDIQFHGVLKRNLRETVQRIDRIQLTTLGACGDVERNVMCCPAPYQHDSLRDQLQAMTQQLSDALLPQTRAFHEVWALDPATGEKELVGGGSDGKEIEPLYGKSYLPRKFKTAVALPEDNCTDVYTNDLGFVAECEGEKIVGYDVLVGGGFGITPSNANTFPALAQPLAFVEPDEVVGVAAAIIKVQRDFGNRSDRKRARMKYLIHDWGLDRFRQKVQEYYGKPLSEPHRLDVRRVEHHLGWQEQGDGRWFYGLNVENGRIADTDDCRLKSALYEICRKYGPPVRITAYQSLIFCDVGPEDRAGIEAVLRDHGVRLSEETSTARHWSMACVALPTCPLAVTESERVFPGVMDQLETELERLGLSNEEFTVRMTGCPNGCARPYNADIAMVGKTKDKYTLYLGGRILGDRLAAVYKDVVPLNDLVPTLVPVLSCYRDQREPGESLGDFCARLGIERLAAYAEQHAAESA